MVKISNKDELPEATNAFHIFKLPSVSPTYYPIITKCLSIWSINISLQNNAKYKVHISSFSLSDSESNQVGICNSSKTWSTSVSIQPDYFFEFSRLKNSFNPIHQVALYAGFSYCVFLLFFSIRYIHWVHECLIHFKKSA